VARLTDFGIAKARVQLATTRDGELKGKLSYMAPEQIQGAPLDRRTDIYACGVVLWSVLAGRRLVRSDDVADAVTEVLRAEIPSICSLRPDVPAAFDAALARALERDPNRRYANARDFAAALEAAASPLASSRAVGEWVQALASDKLAVRDAL